MRIKEPSEEGTLKVLSHIFMACLFVLAWMIAKAIREFF